MGNSFKLQGGGTNKNQARGAGALLICLSIVVYFVIWPLAGAILFALGAIFLLASFAATE